MAKNNNIISNFRGKNEAMQDKQKLYRKFTGKKSKTTSVSGASNNKDPNKPAQRFQANAVPQGQQKR